MPTVELCTFTVAGSEYALPVGEVQEVLGPQAVTPVPLTEPSVVGIVNLRGQLVTVLDLGHRLGIADRTDAEAGAGADQRMHLVLRTEHGTVSVLVDAVGDVVALDEEDVLDPPATISGPASALILGAVDLGDRLLLTLAADDVARPHAAA
jgi:purine-binding chemotaxis protein CheW